MGHIKNIVTFLCTILIVYIIAHSVLNRGVTLYNPSNEMTATVTNQVRPYGTDYVYNESMPSNLDPIVLEEGINGLELTYDGLNYTHLSDIKNQVLQVGTGKQGIYNGTLTGYGPDCPGCSVVGNVSCATREGTNHSITYDGIYYDDLYYGSVRILAADQREFPCGTIVKVNNGVIPEFTGIVLDTGITMINAYSQGIIWMDLAYTTENDPQVDSTTSHNTTFSVQRWGW